MSEVRVPYWLYYSLPRASVAVGCFGVVYPPSTGVLLAAVLVAMYGTLVMCRRIYEWAVY